MKIKPILSICFVSAFLFILPLLIYSQDIQPVKLLAPQSEGGKPLMQALKERKSSREFSPKELSLQVISDLLCCRQKQATPAVHLEFQNAHGL